MSGIWDLLFGSEEDSPKKGGLIQKPKPQKYIPTYKKEEMMPLNYEGALYPKQYDYSNPPVEPTAYSKKTAQKVFEYMGTDYDAFPTEGWEMFLERNKQRIAPEDIDDKVMQDLLANRSAVVAEAGKLGNRGIRTGDWALRSGGNSNMETVGESRLDAPAFWAARNGEGREGMPSYTHESLHQYFRDQGGADDLTPDMKEYLADGGNQHALIDLLDQRLNKFDNYYMSGEFDAKRLDALERRAEQRLGKEMSIKNQGRITSR